VTISGNKKADENIELSSMDKNTTSVDDITVVSIQWHHRVSPADPTDLTTIEPG